jgi:hypothetical protein
VDNSCININPLCDEFIFLSMMLIVNILQDVQNGDRVCLSVRMLFQLENRWKDFYEIWYYNSLKIRGGGHFDFYDR